MALSAADLASMRSEAVLHYPDTCSLIRYTTASDSGGGRSKAASGTVTVACRLEAPQVGIEAESGGRITATEGIVVKVPAGTDVNERDELTVTDGDWPGAYEVVSIDVRSNDIERVLRVQRVG